MLRKLFSINRNFRLTFLLIMKKLLPHLFMVGLINGTKHARNFEFKSKPILNLIEV